jgi:hypothetical protein
MLDSCQMCVHSELLMITAWLLYMVHANCWVGCCSVLGVV